MSALYRTPSLQAVEDAQDLATVLNDRIEQSRIFGYKILFRLFDEEQGGILSQITYTIDSVLDQTPLAEGANKRKVFQRLARLEELKRIIAASRNFCRYVVTGVPLKIGSVLVEILPSIKADFPQNKGNIVNYVDQCIEAVEINLGQALENTLSRFRSNLV